MNQVTAVVQPMWEDGEMVIEVHYSGACGCRWTVDMWGRVRKVKVCSGCMLKPDPFEAQLSWFN